MTNKRRVLSALALVLTISLSQPLLAQKKRLPTRSRFHLKLTNSQTVSL